MAHRSEYLQFRQLHHPDVDPHLLNVQLDRLSNLESRKAHSGLPIFSVVAPGVLAVTFEDDRSELTALGPSIFQLRGRGEVTWAANKQTPGWRLRELKWYAEELSLLDSTDIDLIVDSAYQAPVAEHSRSRRVTGPSPRAMSSPEPLLTVMGTGRYRLTFPTHSGAPEWWDHPVDIDIRDEIIVRNHEQTPQWRFDEIREYVFVLADIHLEAVTSDPELVGASVGGGKGTGTLRRSTWSPTAVRRANTAEGLAAQMENLTLEGSAPPAHGRRASDPAPRMNLATTAITAEPIQEVEAAVRVEIISHGVFGLTWYDPSSESTTTKKPTRVQLLERGIVMDLPEKTSKSVRREFTAAAVDLYHRLAEVTSEVAQVFALSMPEYPMIHALLPPLGQIKPQDLAGPGSGFVRTQIDIHSLKGPATLPSPEQLPRLVLVDPPMNLFRLEGVSKSDTAPTFDLRSRNDLSALVPPSEIDRTALYTAVLRELIGIAPTAPPSVIEMLENGVPIGESNPRAQPVSHHSCAADIGSPLSPRYKLESKVYVDDIGTLRVSFPSLDVVNIPVYFVHDTEYRFELPGTTSVARVAEITKALEHSLEEEIEAWTGVKTIIRQYAPQLPVTALRPPLPELDGERVRLNFSPTAEHRARNNANPEVLPRLFFRQAGIYELVWPAGSGITPTRYEINNGKVGMLKNSRTPKLCMVMWLGVAIVKIFESASIPKGTQSPSRHASPAPPRHASPTQPHVPAPPDGIPLSNPQPASTPPMPASQQSLRQTPVQYQPQSPVPQASQQPSMAYSSPQLYPARTTSPRPSHTPRASLGVLSFPVPTPSPLQTISPIAATASFPVPQPHSGYAPARSNTSPVVTSPPNGGFTAPNGNPPIAFPAGGPRRTSWHTNHSAPPPKPFRAVQIPEPFAGYGSSRPTSMMPAGRQAGDGRVPSPGGTRPVSMMPAGRQAGDGQTPSPGGTRPVSMMPAGWQAPDGQAPSPGRNRPTSAMYPPRTMEMPSAGINAPYRRMDRSPILDPLAPMPPRGNFTGNGNGPPRWADGLANIPQLPPQGASPSAMHAAMQFPQPRTQGRYVRPDPYPPNGPPSGQYNRQHL